MSSLILKNLSKGYGDTIAVSDLSLEISSGEFFSFVGPSGCGKTTVLRMIAGLENPSRGEIVIDGADVTKHPPQRRDTVMVFQNYALFPHMNVFDNVAFGLETRGVSRGDIRTRVVASLELVQLQHKINSRIQDLSGGEQQRVALARAVAVRPKILLMDEPLSNLDITLRADTRREIRELQQATGITTVYVTHDQSEALSLSDRLAVLKDGKMLQAGTPSELYERPIHPFVAAFLGNANLLRGKIIDSDSRRATFRGEDSLEFSVTTKNTYTIGESVLVAVRPEHISIRSLNTDYNFRATIDSVEYQGILTEYRIKVGMSEIRVVSDSSKPPQPGLRDEIGVSIDPDRCFVYPANKT